ncbi:DNA alkylation repair protein [Arthrobacter mobilis]|uniref:DNA alkylation repair protein n=1 Tax=Arthrobacter mobilis TaxID=2724944 RepID=A0A7X6K5H5_9MICC|nr:DNA alkylation repair protein [Arthrobacter mobilis]NKX54234.1 DNA alkylation repair protein [Arthrobacter mobilis]
MGVMNDLLGPEAVDGLRTSLLRVTGRPAWPALAAAEAKLEPLAIRARAGLLAEALTADLGTGYDGAAAVFRAALADEAFTGWMIWPVSEAAVDLALRDGSTRAFDDVLALLAELTPRLTAEFAIRRLLIQDLDRALAAARDWTAHPDEHVRRLASEGTRPYLPWAIRVPEIIARPDSTFPILDALHTDPSQLVRRSVANHLNDLARHAPGEVVSAAARWMEDPDDGAAWVVRHGLRTLVKKAHPGALALLGFSNGSVSVSAPELDRSVVELPGELEFAVEVTNGSEHTARVAVDYLVHYVKANGALAPKVFKLAVADLEPGQTRRFRKSHAFRPMTTRVHYPGRHALQVQVNGVLSPSAGFDVVQ